jgi:flagellar basal-body rod protein FlgC
MPQNIKDHSSLLNGLYVSAAGMQVQNKRVLVISQNMANASSKSDENGNPPYRRKVVTFKEVYDKNKDVNLVQVKSIKEDKSPFNKNYDPNDPAADADGYVYETNVKTMVETMDMSETLRSHEANVKVFEKILQMMQNLISVLKPQ